MYVDQTKPDRILSTPTRWSIIGGIVLAALFLGSLIWRLSRQASDLTLVAALWTVLVLAALTGLVILAYLPNLSRHSALVRANPTGRVWTISYSADTARALEHAYPQNKLRLPRRGYSLMQDKRGVELYAGGARPKRIAFISASEYQSFMSSAVVQGVFPGSALLLSVFSMEGHTEIPFPVTKDRLGLLRGTADPFNMQGNLSVALDTEEPDIWNKRVLVDGAVTSPLELSEVAWLVRYQPEDEADSGWVLLTGHTAPEEIERYTAITYGELTSFMPHMAVLRGHTVGTEFENTEWGLYHRELGLYFHPSPEDLRPLPGIISAKHGPEGN